MQEMIVRKALKFLHPLMVRWGKLHAPWSRKEISVKDLDEIKDYLEPGDVLLTCTKGEFTNLTTPGIWKHTGMVSECCRYVIEAKGPGVLKTDLRAFMLRTDRVALVRVSLKYSERKAAAAFGELLVGKPYDFQFLVPDRKEIINEAFYCSELPHWCFKKQSENYRFKLREIYGALAIAPDDYWFAEQHYRILWVSEKARHLLKNEIPSS